MKEKFKAYYEQAKNKPLSCLVWLLIIVAVFFCITLAFLGNNRNYATHEDRIIIVKDGMTTADIALLLHEKQLVQNPAAFRFEARLKGLAEKLQAGVYQIKGGLNNGEIVDVLAKGKIQTVQFTVPEGFNVVKTAKKLQNEGLGSAEKFIAAAKNYAPFVYMQTEDPNVIFKAEGFLYPSTYQLPVGASEEQILKVMVRQFDEEMNKGKIKEYAAQKELNMRDIVNIAAMVELEAVFADEQPRIAGVFLKRLAIGMPIQSDTTIQYLLGTQKAEITFKDTEIKSPYNTYQNTGLPPGPIASPGIGAIKAVLNPEEKDFLYFVAQKDGRHRFTATYKEHLQAIEEIHGEN